MNWDATILIALKLLAVLVLVLLNGFFVAAEFALVRIRETQLDELVAQNRRGARMARHIVRNLNTYLSATQLGITMASLGLGWLGEPVFASAAAPLLGAWACTPGLDSFHFVCIWVYGADVSAHYGRANWRPNG
jgi:CBS domain containing-hemolysin-like protein